MLKFLHKYFHWHKKKIVKNGQDLYEAFWKRRRQLFRLMVVSVGLTFIALLIVGLKIFYPFHVVIGVGFYVLSFIPFVRRIYLSRQVWQTYGAYTWSANFFRKEKRRLFLSSILVVLTISFFWIRPLDDKPFAHLTDVELAALVANDLYQSVTVMDYLETTGNELLSILNSGREDQNLNEDVTMAFADFLEAVSISESLTDIHRYFANLPYRLWDERTTSFLVSYSLYVKKYEIVHRIMVSVSGNEQLKKILNQKLVMSGQGGTYNDMVNRFYSPKTRLRLTGGYFYMYLFGQPDKDSGGPYIMLHTKAKGSYNYLRENFITTIFGAGELVADNVEQGMVDTWFPIQKTVATAMGRAIITTRGKDGFITPAQADEMEKFMQPGDIMLQRRNWHVSNVGIPGFWTHSALYTGNLNTMDEYFSDEFPYDGHFSMSDYLEANLPNVYITYTEPDKDGNPRAVVEAIEPGVILQSLPVSTNADFVVTLRANVSKHDAFLAILRALENFGKPYDFDFDFDTRDALVCSELIYDAYLERLPDKKGLYFETSVVSGRKVVSPLDMANKFVSEYDTEEQSMDFVYFLRGDEKTQTAYVGTVDDLLESVTWSKFSFLQE